MVKSDNKMMFTKKAVSSQMFIYVMTAVVIGLMFILGAKWIMSLISLSGEVETAQLKVDVEEAFEGVKYRYGSWVNAEFIVPDGVQEMCFLDTAKGKDDTYRNEDICDYSKTDEFNSDVCDAWEYGANSVVLVPPLDTNFEVTDVEIKGPPYYKCVPVQGGRVVVKLTGLGDGVRVS